MTQINQVIECPERIREILISRDFQPYSIAGNYQKLADRFNLDFTAILHFIGFLPVFLHGQKHLDLRKKMVSYLASTKKNDEIMVRQFTSSFIKKVSENGDCRVKSDYLLPLWKGIIKSRNHFDEDEINLIERLPGLFNIYLPLRERIEINQLLDDFSKKHKSDDSMMMLALHSLGFSPFINSILMSLNECMAKANGKAFKDASLDFTLGISSFTYTDRHDKDSYYRCALYSKKYSAQENSKLMFGHGVHACIGKNLTNMVWKYLIESLCQIPHKIEHSELTMQKIPYYKFNSHDEVADPFINCDELEIIFSK